MTTRPVKNNLNPPWMQNIQIPVFVPTWNDKIKVGLWQLDGEYFTSETLLANVPELPSANDVFNI